tara:strand:- start:202 stop:477 length:276 start_codon:yes stop_codon:yes gene_type:complete
MSIDLSSFRDDDRSEAAKSYRGVLESMKDYKGNIRDIESRFSGRKGAGNGRMLFKYHGSDPRGFKTDLENAIIESGLVTLPINIRNPTKHR